MNEQVSVEEMTLSEVLEMTTEIVSAFVSNNDVEASALPGLIESVHRALVAQGSLAAEAAASAEPAVAVKKSVSAEHIVCLDCGRKLKTLKRHLRADHDLSPADYRAKWGLPADYPMVAPSYSKARSAFAKQIGLGRASES
ncbi:MAG: MucR family transcriptional regulator [Proteobacteria bacterium]|nr:MucR family transcriptional regulator [Pseudomonadota bacterium]